MGLTVGIDLGTTNSVVALKKLGVTIVRNAEGEQVTPSCVTCLAAGDKPNFLVGRPAINLANKYPEQTVKSVKRLIGRGFKDREVQYLINNKVVSYPIIADPLEPEVIKISLLGKLYSPEELTAIILKKLIEDSQVELKEAISEAVVTVPAYFSDRQKFATRVACEQVGLKLLRLLAEPTAAVLSFGLENISTQDLKTIMVFDLGGGTFDISVLTLAGGSFMEITKGGDMWLGGDNIDQMLIEYILKEAEKTLNGRLIWDVINNLPLATYHSFLVEIKEKAEALKIALSQQESASIEMLGVFQAEDGELIDIAVTLSRAKFNEIIKPVTKKVMIMAKQILDEIHFEAELIDTVLMVGGSALIVAIQEELKKLFGKDKVIIHPRPMLAVAEGAAIMAAQMQQTEASYHDFAMTHVASHDYYLQLAAGKRHLLVARNTPLPVTVHEKLKFCHHKQILARLRVLNAVDDVLEPVGEIWFYKRLAYWDLDLDFESNKLEELNLAFTVDQDNIITMKVGSEQDHSLQVESQIARGGLSIKLYNELEQALAATVSRSKNIAMEMDLLFLSNEIVLTILKVADPLTGKVDLAKKEQAEQQINLLRLLAKNNLAPLALYKFAIHVGEIGDRYKILSRQDKLELADLITNLKIALAELQDLAQFKDLNTRLDRFSKNFPIIIELIMIEKAAKVINQEEPLKAQEILDHAKIMVKYHLQQEKFLAETIKAEIYQEIGARVAFSDDASQRFDRDVTL